LKNSGKIGNIVRNWRYLQYCLSMNTEAFESKKFLAQNIILRQVELNPAILRALLLKKACGQRWDGC
jgi:hypothetical protein